MHTKVIYKIADIPVQEWNKVFPDVLEGYHFSKTLDESGIDQFAFFYILVYEGENIVGAVPCFLVDYSLDTSINGPLRRLTNFIKKIFPDILKLKVLAAGIPMHPGQMGIAGDPQAVLGAVVQRMEEIARETSARILVFKDFGQSYEPILDSLKGKDFLKIDSLPNTELAVNFSNFEDYLKTLSGATRYDLRRKFKRSSHVNIEFTVVDALDEKTLDEAYQLYLYMVESHDMKFELLPKDFFRLVSKNMPQQVKFFLWRVDGKLGAFLFCLVSDDLLIDYYLGLDSVLGRQHHLYFVKFKYVLEWCITHGIKKYEMSTTGYEPKRRLGFGFVPLYFYIRHCNKALRPFFNYLCTFLKFENFDQELKRWKRS